ncbi:MAG TPA: hypothetical protein VFW21_06360 [Mycobacterium sp.]|nr:hypothetical protein [Mycobacterium sp.]
MNRLFHSGVLITVALGLLAPVTSAFADPAQPPIPIAALDPSQPVTFGIRPATAKGPDDRPRLSYTAAPGSVIKDFVAVTNISDIPLTLRVYAADAFNTSNGGYDLLAFGHPSIDVGAWAATAMNSVSVAARATAIVPFTLSVPDKASPGDHSAGIVASLTSEQVDAKGDRILVDKRVGTRIYLRVPGDLRPALKIEGLDSTFHQTLNPVGHGRTTVTYTVHNIGNLRLQGSQRLQVRTPWGSTAEGPRLPDIPQLLPGSSVSVTSDVDGVLPAFWDTAAVRVDPIPPPGDQDPVLPVAAASDTFAAVPWALLTLLVALGLAVLVWRTLRRRRDGRPGQGPEGPVNPEVPHAPLQ